MRRSKRAGNDGRVIVRGIFLKGVGADILWPQMAAVAAMGLAALSLASSQASTS